MSPADAVLIAFGAVVAGAMNAVVGAGTLVTFPMLLAMGVPPIVANVSNSIGLVPGAVTGAYGFRSTLSGRAGLVTWLAVGSAIGGIAGGVLLLRLPPEAFERVVPPLLLAAAAMAAVQPRVAAHVVRRRERRAAVVPADGVAAALTPGATAIRISPVLWLAVLFTGVYGGYFGAAQGVVLLAVLGMFAGGDLQEVNGIKNVLAGVANLVSSLLFVGFARVDWRIVGLVAVGAATGGGLGGRYGRRLPARLLRMLVVLVAVTAAIWRYLG